jgi:hypothetical protein
MENQQLRVNHLQNTIYEIKQTNKIFLDYTTFRHFACKENYIEIVSHIVNTIQNVLTRHETFEIHVNLHSFNTTSLVKHREFLHIFAEYSNMFDNKLTDFYVYYTPSIMDSIFKIVSNHIFRRDTSLTPQVILYPKKNSENALNALLS